MASDQIIWSIINGGFCSFKLKTTKEKTFCREPHNATGLCNSQSCPLANSRYATVRADPNTGILYLYMKTVERAHLPSKLWERHKLSANYATALEQISEKLIYWPGYLIHRCKQRLTRLTQVNVRMRKIAKEEARLGERLVPKLAPKIKRREETRERKAEAAAKLERTIERELIQRLREGAYGDQPLNVNENIWQKVLNGLEREGEGTRDKDKDKGIEEEEEYEEEYENEEEVDDEDGAVEYVSDFDESEDDLEDIEDWLGSDEDQSEEDSETADSEEEASKKVDVGSKRKRQPTKGVKNPKKKISRRGKEIERETEFEPRLREELF